MNLPQHGTIATTIGNQIISTDLSLYKVTSTETIDLQTTFNKLSLRLDQLDFKSEGNNEDIDILSKHLNLLPRFSDERLECDIRIQSLKKKWGLLKQSVPLQNVETFFPIELNDVDDVLIEKSHEEYINSGKDGREFIQSHLIQSGIKVIRSEEELNKFVQEALLLLDNKIMNVHTASTIEEWKISLRKLGINAIQHSTTLFKVWLESNKNNLKTIGQLKTWISGQEKNALLNETVANTIDSSFINKISFQ